MKVMTGFCFGYVNVYHRAGIVHRDFKSDNVMLALDEVVGQTRAVVMDFGLARSSGTAPLVASFQDGRSLVGTVGYMAPEQVEGRPCTPLSDLYALGIVLYEMLTGALPWDGDAALVVASQRLMEPPPPPRLRARRAPARGRRRR